MVSSMIRLKRAVSSYPSKPCRPDGYVTNCRSTFFSIADATVRIELGVQLRRCSIPVLTTNRGRSSRGGAVDIGRP